MHDTLTTEQRVTNNETRQHILLVAAYIHEIVKALLDRCDRHDTSKLSTPEVEILTEYTPRLRETTYGSEQYKVYLAEMGTALQHHYANNRHHPEHFDAGIAGMNLVDLVEMFCDWIAATARHADGNIYASIRLNTERFGLPPELASILMNTARLFLAEHR